MDFTREPIIETIITPKEGCKLVVRSSKGAGQEEFFVDAIEVVTFGEAHFFRSLERPKPFLVPVSDYEVVEVKETRMVLKSAAPDRSIKIGGGREASRAKEEKAAAALGAEEEALLGEEEKSGEVAAEARSDVRLDKKRDRRKNYRKRRGVKEEQPAKEEVMAAAEAGDVPALEEGGKVKIQPPEAGTERIEGAQVPLASSLLTSLLQPPPALISETISRYRENAMFKNAFFLAEEEQYKPHDKVQELLNEEEEEIVSVAPLQEPVIDFLKEGEESLVQEQLGEKELELPIFEEEAANGLKTGEEEPLFFIGIEEPLEQDVDGMPKPDHSTNES